MLSTVLVNGEPVPDRALLTPYLKLIEGLKFDYTFRDSVPALDVLPLYLY